MVGSASRELLVGDAAGLFIRNYPTLGRDLVHESKFLLRLVQAIRAHVYTYNIHGTYVYWMELFTLCSTCYIEPASKRVVDVTVRPFESCMYSIYIHSTGPSNPYCLTSEHMLTVCCRTRTIKRVEIYPNGRVASSRGK